MLSWLSSQLWFSTHRVGATSKLGSCAFVPSLCNDHYRLSCRTRAFCLPVHVCCCGKHHEQKQLKEERVYFRLPITAHHRERPGQELAEKTEVDCSRRTPPSLSSQLPFFAAQSHSLGMVLPTSGLALPRLIRKRPSDKATGQNNESNSRTEAPTLGWAKLRTEVNCDTSLPTLSSSPSS